MSVETIVLKRPSHISRGCTDALLTFSEYFAGIGLVREGLTEAGWKPLFANDIDPKKQEIYVMNYGPDHFALGDVYNLDPNDVPTTLLATASFPCIDLSLAGSRRGLEGEHSGAFWGFFQVLRGMGDRRPPIVMLENVPGFLTSKEGADFLAVVDALNGLGYRCDAFQVNASHFVPQSRPRIFVVGAQGNIMPQFDPNATNRSTRLRPKTLDKLIRENAKNWGEVPLPDLPDRNKDLADILEAVPEDSDLWWSPEEVQKLVDSMSDKHRAIAEQMFSGNEYSYGAVYRRTRDGVPRAELRTDGIAGALRTATGGSSRQFLFVAGRRQYKVRLLTGREYGRLQGVRDTYQLEGITDNHARFGFGDAVCVPAIRWIAEHCLNPLAENALALQLQPA